MTSPESLNNPADASRRQTTRQHKTQRRQGTNDPILENGMSNDIVIPVMGPTGAGKSTFINAVLGEQSMVVGHTLVSCTTNLCPVVISSVAISIGTKYPILKNKRVVLVDTPGFDDTYKGDVEILRRISIWLETSYRKKMVLGGVLYLHDISQDRFSGTARRNLDMFRHLCGDDALKQVALGTTKWGRVTPEVGENRVKELKEVHWTSMLDKGAMVLQFKDTTSSALALIDHILRRVVLNTALQIQKELAIERKLIPETKAGQELRYTLQQVLEMQRQMVGYEEAVAERGDPEAQMKLEETRESMRKVLVQVQDLKIPLKRKFLGMIKRFFFHD